MVQVGYCSHSIQESLMFCLCKGRILDCARARAIEMSSFPNGFTINARGLGLER